MAFPPDTKACPPEGVREVVEFNLSHGKERMGAFSEDPIGTLRGGEKKCARETSDWTAGLSEAQKRVRSDSRLVRLERLEVEVGCRRGCW